MCHLDPGQSHILLADKGLEFGRRDFTQPLEASHLAGLAQFLHGRVAFGHIVGNLEIV